MAWFDDLKTPRIAKKKTPEAERPPSKVPEGLWVKCPKCGEVLQSKILQEQAQVCPECDFHFRMSAQERLGLFLAQGGKEACFEEFAEGLRSQDPLQFDDTKPYRMRLQSAMEQTQRSESVLAGQMKSWGSGRLSFFLGLFDFRFMGGSMGVVAGEKIALVFEKALEHRLPAVVVSASGGARMQEGIFSLMQMAKTTALLAQMRKEGIPYVSVLTDPTTGGVAASFAMLGDLILAEPEALIGFAGPRVIEQSIRQTLPPGFQRSEFLLQHGFVDRIVHRQNWGKELAFWLSHLGKRTCHGVS